MVTAANIRANTKQELMIHLRRLRHVGEFTVVLIHAIAHIKSRDLANDAARNFGKIFFQLCSEVAAKTFAEEDREAGKSVEKIVKSLSAFANEPALVDAILEADEGESTEDEEGY
tara:strand:- start:95 stop:439 length:345 start_codon:yes stop_codon:yes gene_type:complete